MKSGNCRGLRAFRPRAERMEDRLVMSGNFSVPAEVRAILNSSVGGAPVRPNTPVLPLESAYTTATYVDPTVKVFQGNRTRIGQRDFIAPDVTLNAVGGYIKIRSTSTIQDNATLTANPARSKGVAGIFVGDNVVIGTGATIIGPASIGGASGPTTTTAAAATSIGANAVIDGAIIQPGAFVGALARVGPGVTVPTGYRVLPGANVTDEAQINDPTVVVRVTSADTSAAMARSVIANNSALALGYAELYQGSSATGGAGSAGPIPSAIAAAGSTIFFGGLNTVLGASGEPTSKYVNFEPAAGTPQFLTAAGTFANLAPNVSYRFPARVVGQVTFNQQAVGIGSAFSRTTSIRADEGQPIVFGGPIAHLGNRVSIHSPGGGVSTTTTTTVTTATTAVGVTTTTSTTTNVITPGAATATAGTTTVTTTGVNAAGVATTGVITTTISTRTTNLGTITIGARFTALDGAVILGGPTTNTVIGPGVTVGRGAVVQSSTLGEGVVIGSRAYVSNSTIAVGTIVPDRAIIINNVVQGTVQS